MIKAYLGYCPIHGSSIFRLTKRPPIANKPGFLVYRCDHKGCDILQVKNEKR